MALSEESQAVWEQTWEDVAPSQYAWEHEVHERLKRALNVVPPFQVWANFEFIDLHGATFNVDLMIFTGAGIFVVDLFSGTGTVHVTERHWRWVDGEGAAHILDDPVAAVGAKARRLHDLVEHFIASNSHAPRIQGLACVVRDDTEVTFASADLRHRIVGMPGHPDLPDIVAALQHADAPGVASVSHGGYDEEVLGRFHAALGEVGLDPSRKYRKVGEWQCGRLLETSENHQDYVGTHLRRDAQRRVRVFFSPRNTSSAQRERLAQSARREFELVRQLDHRNILSVEEHVRDGRSALVFAHPHGALRLDKYLTLRQQGQAGPGQLTARERLEILRQCAEAILYAHRKRIIHRALTPLSVLVTPPEDASAAPHVTVYNWQAALDRAQETGTRHVMEYMADSSALYTAPEVRFSHRVSVVSDVWGLGTIAYLLFRGEPPADDPEELVSKLMKQQGLSLSAQMDGIPASLERLVANATHPNPAHRTASVEEFVRHLEQVWDALQLGRAGQHAHRDPLDAQPGEVLDDTWEVLARLGAGASSTAFLVRDDAEREVVLKIAQTDKDAARLEREARELDALSSVSLVVGCQGSVAVGKRRALILEYAGETLRDRLGKARLSLDDLRRFGADLLEVLVQLEHHHVWHRDIKPANLGIGTPAGSTQRLMLFDFSLAGSKPDSIEVGTAAYRDPLLPARRRWDEHADRWAAAMTLYEMATGSLPRWPDDVAALFDEDAQMLLDADALPASVRLDLVGFFTRALQRDAAQRFETAAQMRQRWRTIFEDTTHTEHDDVSAAIESATRATSVLELEFSSAAREALDRLDIMTVGDLIDANPQSIFFQRGTSAKVRRELHKVRERLIARLPEDERPLDMEAAPGDYTSMSLDRCAADYAFEQESQIAEIWGLTLEEAEQANPWISRRAMAAQMNFERTEFEDFFQEVAAGWKRKRSLRPLREDVVELLEHASGALTGAELARALLAKRGSRTHTKARRMLLAAVMARVAVEAEGAEGEGARYIMHRIGEEPFIALSHSRLPEVLSALGDRADELAKLDPLVGERRAYVELARVCDEAEVGPPRSGRLLSLAVAASDGAALSSRREIYPKGMRGERALRLSAGIISGRQTLSVEELRERVTVRYPEAQPLPTRERVSELERMLEDLKIPLRWDPEHDHFATTASSAIYLSITSSRASSTYSALEDAQAYDLQMFDKDLTHAYDWGGFRVLMVSERYLQRAEEVLLERFDRMRRVSCDRIWIDAMMQAAQQGKRRLEWEHLAAADAPNAPRSHKYKFGKLVERANRFAEDALTAHIGADVLLVHPGLLGRYADHGSMQVLERWRERANTDEGPRLLWMLVPADRQSDDPKLHGHAVPRMSRGEVMRIERHWVKQALAE